MVEHRYPVGSRGHIRRPGPSHRVGRAVLGTLSKSNRARPTSNIELYLTVVGQGNRNELVTAVKVGVIRNRSLHSRSEVGSRNRVTTLVTERRKRGRHIQVLGVTTIDTQRELYVF